MDDLRQRFASLDRLRTPDLWDEIELQASVLSSAARVAPGPVPVSVRARGVDRRALAVLVAAALLLGLLLQAVGSGSISLPQADQSPTPRPGPTNTATAVQPPPPASNGLVAYEWGEDIFVGDPRTGETTAILSGPERDILPVFSPDGATIAFTRLGETPLDDTILVVRPDGSGERVVVPAGVSSKGMSPALWTPDGTAVVVVHNGTTSETPYWDGELSMFDAVGTTGRRDLTPPLNRQVGGPFFAPNAGVAPIFQPPDGDLILSSGFSFPSGSDVGLAWFDAELQPLGQLGQAALAQYEPYFVDAPTWSPDGSTIAFGLANADGRGTYGGRAAFLIHADGTGLRPISAWGQWSPDGTMMAAERWAEAPEPEGSVIVIVDIESGAERVLEVTSVLTKIEGDVPDAANPNFHGIVGPDGRKFDYEGWFWTPDGRSIVFLEQHGGRPLVVNVETGVATELPWVMDSVPSWQRVPLTD